MFSNPLSQQIDYRWIERLRSLTTYDSGWWMTWAGPFTKEEQQMWERLSLSSPHRRKDLAFLLKESREREIAAAWSEQRNPRLVYPAIDRDQLQTLLAELKQLAEEIRLQENNSIVRRLYLEKIESEICSLQLIEACAKQDREQFWRSTCLLTPPPTQPEILVALSYIKRVLRLASAQSETAKLSQMFQESLSVFLPGLLDATLEETNPLPFEQEQEPDQPNPLFEAAVVACFFEGIFNQIGFPGWKVEISANASNASTDSANQILVLRDQPLSLTKIRHLIIHELGHALRGMVGARSQLGLLGLGTGNYAPTEEGYLHYQERLLLAQHGQLYDDAGQRLSILAVGLASGAFGSPVDFYQLWKLLGTFAMLPRLLRHPASDQQQVQNQANSYALLLCLRVFRGVPHLDQPGICNTKDVIYLRGLQMIEQAVARDGTVLEQLAVGKVGLEDLDAVHALGVKASLSTSLVSLALDPYLSSTLQRLEVSP